MDFVKRTNERTAIINNLQAQNQAILNKEASTDEIDMFFKSMALSVKKLPPSGRTEAKFQVLTLVSHLEDKYLNATQPTLNIFQSIQIQPIQPFHLPYSNSPSPCLSSSSNSQGYTPNCMKYNNYTDKSYE